METRGAAALRPRRDPRDDGRLRRGDALRALLPLAAALHLTGLFRRDWGPVQQESVDPATPRSPGGSRFIQDQWNSDVVARGEQLMDALATHDSERVDQLLGGCWDVSVRDPESGNTALIVAAKRGQSALGVRILEHGSDVNDVNDLGESALSLAVSFPKCFQFVNALLKENADPNHYTDDGLSPLLLAASSSGCGKIAQSLLDFQANPDASTGADGATALHIAARRGDAEMCCVLLAGRADPHVPLPGGTTPLYLATVHGHPHVVDVLAEFGACSC